MFDGTTEVVGVEAGDIECMSAEQVFGFQNVFTVLPIRPRGAEGMMRTLLYGVAMLVCIKDGEDVVHLVDGVEPDSPHQRTRPYSKSSIW
jgi:hypothetical protein